MDCTQEGQTLQMDDMDDMMDDIVVIEGTEYYPKLN